MDNSWASWHSYIWKRAIRDHPYLSDDDLHDMVLEAECEVAESKHTYQPDKGTYQAWLTRIILLSFKNFLSRYFKHQAEDIDTIAEETYEPFQAYEESNEVATILGCLPERYKRVTIEILMEGRSHAEFASRYHLSENYIHYRLVPETKRALREAYERNSKHRKSIFYQDALERIERARYDPNAAITVIRRRYQFDEESDYLNRPYCWKIF